MKNGGSESLTFAGVGREYELGVDYSEATDVTEEEVETIITTLEHMGFFEGLIA